MNNSQLKIMDFFTLLLSLSTILTVSETAIVLRPFSSINIPSMYGPNLQAVSYAIESDTIEQSAYDEETGLVYAAGDHYIHIIDYSNLTDPVILHAVPVINQVINDVEQCGSRVAFALTGSNQGDPGEIHIYNLYDKELGAASFTMEFMPITVGDGPDMLHFSKDCDTIVTADEGEPYTTVVGGVPGGVIDPEGSVSIIRLHDTMPNVTTVNFTAFNARADEYIRQGVRQNYKGQLSSTPSLFSQTMEPEYVTFNKDESLAYVVLQEANAMAVVDLQTDTIEEIFPLGVKSWKDLVLDASDKDGGINLNSSYDIYSFYQPDGIKFFDFLGQGYIITGNEGETSEYDANSPKQQYADAKRGRKMLQDVQISPNLHADLREALSDDTKLGRLEFSVIDGLSANIPTQVERLHFFGGRGISIFKADDMTQVWDSGDMIEKLHAELYPEVFNANSKPDNPALETPADLMDKRSDNHGPECEALAFGEVGNSRLLFVGMGRTSTIAIFRLEATFDGPPHTPVLEFESLYRAGATNETFNSLLENKNIGNLDPEDIRFIPASKSSTGNPLLLVTGTTSGNLVMYEVIDEGFAPPSGASAMYWSFLSLFMTTIFGVFATI